MLFRSPDSIFDVQVKRLHEYKRQHLNVMNILADYSYLINNPDADFMPKTYIFAAKAAPGYYLAKQIIKMIWAISEEIRKNPKIKQKLQVVFLENYCVTLSELLMPASEISEQISLAGLSAFRYTQDSTIVIRHALLTKGQTSRFYAESGALFYNILFCFDSSI